MALADVLSAMREVILDAPLLPAEREQRIVFFKERYPQLSSEEREDLAQIDPAKFKIYTVSIFQSEKGILDNHFPITLELLKRHWQEVYQTRFVGWKLTQTLHQKRPWKSQSPLSFAGNFAAMINDDCQELLSVRPDIGAIASLELETYRLRRAPNQLLMASDAESLSSTELFELKVSELLEKQILFNQNIITLEIEYDVVPVREYFYSNNRTAPEEIAPKEDVFLIGCRSQKNAILWLNLTESLIQYIQENRGKKILVQDLAERILDNFQETKDEQQMLQYLIEQLALLSSHQFIRIIR